MVIAKSGKDSDKYMAMSLTKIFKNYLRSGERAFGKTQPPFMLQTLNQLSVRVIYLHKGLREAYG